MWRLSPGPSRPSNAAQAGTDLGREGAEGGGLRPRKNPEQLERVDKELDKERCLGRPPQGGRGREQTMAALNVR